MILDFTLLVPSSPGLVSLLNAARSPFHVQTPLPLHDHARLLVWSHPNREFFSYWQSVGEPAPPAQTTGSGYRACSACDQGLIGCFVLCHFQRGILSGQVNLRAISEQLGIENLS